MSYQFAKWKWSRWETPISDARGVAMNVSLIEGKLEVIFETSSNFDSGLLIKCTFGKIGIPLPTGELHEHAVA